MPSGLDSLSSLTRCSIFFDDFHDSGIYSWDFLHNLYLEKDTIMDTYLKNLEKEGKSRFPPEKKKKVPTANE